MTTGNSVGSAPGCVGLDHGETGGGQRAGSNEVTSLHGSPRQKDGGHASNIAEDSPGEPCLEIPGMLAIRRSIADPSSHRDVVGAAQHLHGLDAFLG